MLPSFYIGSLSIRTYGLCVSFGLIIMALTAFLLGRRYGILLEDIVFGELTALSGAFIGAHIFFALTNIDKLSNGIYIFIKEKRDFSFLLDLITVYAGGMVFYGGLLGGLLFGIIYCKIRKINLGMYSDCFAAAIPLFHAFGRVGCFLSGCCYGIESEFGFTAHSAIVDSCNHVNRFPVQLLESALNLIIFAVLLYLFRKRIMEGRLIALYLIMYAVVRFFDEFLRGDEYRGIYFFLSTSQWLSLIIFICAVIILIKNKKQRVK